MIIAENGAVIELSLITVLYGSDDAVRRYFPTWSLAARNLPTRINLILVDNCHSDGSCEELIMKVGWPSNVKLSVIGLANVGFAKAVGIAAVKSRPSDDLILLNPDVAVGETFFNTIDDWCSNSSFDAAALTLRTPEGTVHTGVAVSRSLQFRDAHERLGRAWKWIGPSGGGCVVKPAGRAFIDYSPQFFAWGEDVDACLRAERQGVTCELLEVDAVHEGGHSLSNARLGRKKAFWLARNRIWIWRRNTSLSLKCLLIPAWVVAAILYIGRGFRKGTMRSRFAGTIDGLRTAPRTLPASDVLSVRRWYETYVKHAQRS